MSAQFIPDINIDQVDPAWETILLVGFPAKSPIKFSSRGCKTRVEKSNEVNVDF